MAVATGVFRVATAVAKVLTRVYSVKTSRGHPAMAMATEKERTMATQTLAMAGHAATPHAATATDKASVATATRKPTRKERRAAKHAMAMATSREVVAMATTEERGHVATLDEMAMAARMVVATRVANMAIAATALLTVAAFVLSYAHLAHVAAANGVPEGVHSWIWPGTIDTFIVIGEMLILHSALADFESKTAWGWGLTIGGSLASIAFNVAGVGADASPMEYATAAAPPVAALFAFGALMHQVRQHVAALNIATQGPVTGAEIMDAARAVLSPVAIPERPMATPTVATVEPVGHVATATRDKSVATATVSLAKRGHVATTAPVATATREGVTVTATTRAAKRAPVAKRKPATAVATADMVATRVASVATMLRDGKTVDGDDVANMYGVSGRTGRRILGDARKAVAA